MATFYRDKKFGKIYINQKIDGERFRESTGIEVAEKDWNKGKATSNVIKFNGDSINSLLIQCEHDLNRAISDITRDGGGKGELKALFKQYRSGNRTIRRVGAGFLEYFKRDYEAQQSGAIPTSTWKHYRSTYRILVEYFDGKQPTFNEIDETFSKSFKLWLYKEKSAMDSTVGGHIKRIKAVMRKAADAGLHKSVKFEKMKRPSYSTDNIYLTPVEIEKIAYAVLPERLDLVRDYFLLSCYCGHRISDWTLLEKSAIKNGIWSYISRKSKVEASVSISDKVLAILDKYDGKLPEPYADQTMNEFIKKVCEIAGITENYTQQEVIAGKLTSSSSPRYKLVSSHTGRRTFTTLLVLSAKVPIHLIMLQTGHKTLASFETYIKLRKLQGEAALKDVGYRV